MDMTRAIDQNENYNKEYEEEYCEQDPVVVRMAQEGTNTQKRLLTLGRIFLKITRNSCTNISKNQPPKGRHPCSNLFVSLSGRSLPQALSFKWFLKDHFHVSFFFSHFLPFCISRDPFSLPIMNKPKLLITVATIVSFLSLPHSFI